MRYLRSLMLATAALSVTLLAPQVVQMARAQEDMHERTRMAVLKTDDDLQRFVHRDNLTEGERDRFEAAMRDLHEFREAVANGHWDGARERLGRTIENIEFVANNATIGEREKEALRDDVRRLREARDGWR
jgi:hypothetical protein